MLETSQILRSKVPWNLYIALIVSSILTLMPVVLLQSSDTADFSSSVYVTLGIIGVIAIAMIIVEAYRGTMLLNLTHWLFMYLFMFVAPLVQYTLGVFPWGDVSSSDQRTLQATNLILLVWALSWLIGRALGNALKPLNFGFIRISQHGIYRTVLLSVVAVALLIHFFGLGSLLTRGAYVGSLFGTIQNSSTAQIVDKLLRGLPVAAVAGYFVLPTFRTARLTTRVFLGVLVVSLLFVADFPFGSSRYWSASIYLGILISLIYSRKWSGWVLVAALILGIAIIFPALNVARRAQDFNALTWSFNREVFSFGENLISGDFDAYSRIARTWIYVTEGPGVSYGWQLLGAVLFWVPRTLWLGKPFGSGQTVAAQEGLPYTNLSCPLPAEGLINFGWFGVSLFAIGTAWIFTQIDREASRSHDKKSFIRAIYPFWIGFAFFMLRGDLMSSLAYLVGFTIAFLPLMGLGSNVRKYGQRK